MYIKNWSTPKKPASLWSLLPLVLLPFSAIALGQDLFSARDVFELEYATDPQIASDGEHIAYVRRSNDIMTDRTRSNIWLLRADGSDHRPLLSGTANYSSPRWSPDGTRLAYLSNEERGSQLYVRWMDTGQTALLTNIQNSASNISWSPDGQIIAFNMNVEFDSKPFSVSMPDKPEGADWSPAFKYVTETRYQADGSGILEPAYSHVFVVPAEGGTPRQLTQGNFNHRSQLSWTPDSEEILFSANRNENWALQSREADLFAVNLAGELRQITSEPGVETAPQVSPDGRLIAYGKTDNAKLAYRNRYLHVIGVDGSGDKNLSADIDNSLSDWRWDGNSALYYQVTNRGIAEVARVSLDGGHQTIASGMGGESLGRPYTSGSYSAASNLVVVTKGSDTRPADLFAIRNRSETRLTELNEDLLAHKKLGQVHEIIYDSSIDGEEIQGWYLTPPDYDPEQSYPLILEIHGGPHSAYGPHFSAEMQRMAAAGYVVFFNNHRGSTSYGERFALLLQNKYSSEYDFADHMSGIDVLIEQGIADPDRLYITGGSAGGIAAAYAIGLTDRFKAAAVAKPVVNWVSKVLTADSGIGQIANQFPGMPWENIDDYWQRSPLSLIPNMTTPTLLMTGEADRRTPISETEQMYQALKIQGVDVVMVRVPGSPHGIAGRPSRLIGKVENILAWFEKYQ
ncbi:MAG TPA: peptidase S9 family protein [Gammaproteobacteria bacterium]|nr:peptidase S9 family protein [Gammaproteobacteria bacterium]HCA35955.1 peptidase S9 family protein [Gammaproteobacteria bacterium]